MSEAPVLSALAQELAHFSVRIARLQDVPWLGDGSPIGSEGADLVPVMVAIQDLDRLTQDTRALSEFLQAIADGSGSISEVCEALSAMPLRSMADRLTARLMINRCAAG